MTQQPASSALMSDSEEDTERKPSRRAAARAGSAFRESAFWTGAQRYLRRFHPVGLAVALLFFIASMTPSLLPRPWYLQSVATGISIVTGYGLGCLAAWAIRRCGVHPAWQTKTKRVGYLSQTYAGKMHDKKIVDTEPIRYPPGTILYKDTGFQGYEPKVQQTHQPKKSRARAR